MDKLLNPLYLVLGGPGSGKSKMLTELPALCAKVAEGHAALTTRLRDVVEFRISFENGTSFSSVDEGSSPSTAIGTRMLWQLGAAGTSSFPKFAANTRVHAEEVLREVARQKGCDPRGLSVYVLVDGVQMLGVVNHMLSPTAEACLRVVAALVTSQAFFVVGVCAATIEVPITHALKGKHTITHTPSQAHAHMHTHSTHTQTHMHAHTKALPSAEYSFVPLAWTTFPPSAACLSWTQPTPSCCSCSRTRRGSGERWRR
jgi:hypothetical protein